MAIFQKNFRHLERGFEEVKKMAPAYFSDLRTLLEGARQIGDLTARVFQYPRRQRIVPSDPQLPTVIVKGGEFSFLRASIKLHVTKITKPRTYKFEVDSASKPIARMANEFGWREVKEEWEEI